MATVEQTKFYFLITYFKTSGKYYTSASVHWECRPLDANQEVAYFHDAIAKVRGLRDCGGPGALPGLCGEGWSGPILIEQAVPKGDPPLVVGSPDDFIPDGVPHLLLPH